MGDRAGIPLESDCVFRKTMMKKSFFLTSRVTSGRYARMDEHGIVVRPGRGLARNRGLRRPAPLGLAFLLTASVSLSAFAADPDVAKPYQKRAHSQARAHPVRRAASSPAAESISPKDETIQVSASRFRSHGAEAMVTRRVMDQFVSGTSPLKILSATTPGVTFASDDAFGLDTAANTLYIRGFDQSQIAGTLDGIPMGDQGFLQYNGLSVDQAAIQDNIVAMSVSQGGGAVDVPSLQNLGGAIQFHTADPDDRMGGRATQMFGSNNAVRTFVRLDSGKLNASGTKFFVSMARTDNDKWKGYGSQLEEQVNAKLEQPVGDIGTITALFNWSSFRQFNYLNIDMNMFRTFGTSLDYLYPNYAVAYNAALGIYPAAYQALGNASDEANATYLDGAQTQENDIMGLIGDFHLTSRLSSKTILYSQLSNGDYEATQPFASPNGAPFAQVDGKPDMRRIGFTEALTYEIGRNVAKTGIWYENNSFSFPNYLYQQPLLGEGPPRNPLGPFHDPFAEELDDRFNSNTFQYYLQDTYEIFRNLHIAAGFRSVLQTTYGGAKQNDPDLTGQDALPDGSLTASNAFLPHFSINYRINPHNELYLDIAENMRAYTYNPWFLGNGGAWSVGNQQQFLENRNDIKPERTWNYVIGYRYGSRAVDVTADIYHVDYYNRLLNTEAGSPLQPISTFVNAGREEVNGGDASVTIRPFAGLEILNTASYTDAEYRGDINYEGANVSLKGKNQVAYPRFIYKANASYTYGTFQMNFNATYTGRRPLSYVNDVYVPSYWVAGLSGTYGFGRIGFARHVQVSFGVTNLFNSAYIGGLGISGFPVSGDYPTLFIGAPRQYFGTVSAQF
ncbi:TonB-dependent receptor [Nguyenibacter vanlangensis]|nr:TonB-dependent receptor [Nguyenibacter vanlangensis]